MRPYRSKEDLEIMYGSMPLIDMIFNYSGAAQSPTHSAYVMRECKGGAHKEILTRALMEQQCMIQVLLEKVSTLE